ncbi:hypothetical protein B0H66DRAFT_306077 [Apodospora peruviana]|uniref:Uncharacterized protein n=1 Tax=Apodospora peruviana TaxID=516989 RepID=A0AAE0I1M1_9PEZI|nr:hypothetical protein B0H66DRAFT_306077 [Apodospora peruviana]
MAQPQRQPPSQSQLTWPRTKLTFYIWWTMQTFIPCILSVVSLIGYAISIVSATKPPPRDKHDELTLVDLLLGIGVPLANLTLLYYLSVKLRVVVAGWHGMRRRPSPPSLKSRWFESALATQEFLLSTKKGAAVLFVAAAAWVPAIGVSSVAMVILVMFAGSGFGGLLGFVGLVIGGLSLIGHLVYVWGRSLKFLVMGSSNKGREVGEGEDGEMLLPLPLAGEERA